MKNDKAETPNRRAFIQHSTGVGAVTTLSGLLTGQAAAAEPSGKKTKVGVIGCGSVSRKYLPHLKSCPFVELVSTCDIIPERSKQAAELHNVPNHYPHIDEMLAGASFDLLVDLTDMQEHYRLNKQALEAGKHVWSEKPMANDLAGGQELLDLAKKKGVSIWGAPTVVMSPQFHFMAKTLREGKLGRVAAAHASYGNAGPSWSSFFYDKNGGSMPDLGVYNLMTLTGLFGPAHSIVAMLSTVTPTREIRGKGKIKVEAEDNSMVLMDHGDGVISHMQCGFNYHKGGHHAATNQSHHTIAITATGGSMYLAGYDWAPHGVDLALLAQGGKMQRHAVTDSTNIFPHTGLYGGGYSWQQGASHVAECLATGKQPEVSAEHALHVIEIINAARESQRTGQRIAIKSRFSLPAVKTP
jgi:predicted dehydrogenase